MWLSHCPQGAEQPPPGSSVCWCNLGAHGSHLSCLLILQDNPFRHMDPFKDRLGTTRVPPVQPWRPYEAVPSSLGCFHPRCWGGITLHQLTCTSCPAEPRGEQPIGNSKGLGSPFPPVMVMPLSQGPGSDDEGGGQGSPTLSLLLSPVLGCMVMSHYRCPCAPCHAEPSGRYVPMCC